MAEIKTEKRSLRYDFTAVETHELSLSLANKTKELCALEEEKSSVVSQYGAKIKECRASCNKISNQVSDGWELREVESEIEYHIPSEGRKTITRKDTGKKFEEKMESWEWNLFNQPGGDDDLDLPELENPKPKKGRKKKSED
jgi:hypothetical protein